jgi:hypothetical protein
MISLERFCMSVGQTTDTDVVVYVRLLDEGTDVWRPVRAKRLPNGTFELGEPEDYDPETELWEFLPHARVKCVATNFAGGRKGLVAVARAA